MDGAGGWSVAVGGWAGRRETGGGKWTDWRDGGGAEGCCEGGRESVVRDTGGLSRSILDCEVEPGEVAPLEEVAADAAASDNEVPRGGTTNGELNGRVDIVV